MMNLFLILFDRRVNTRLCMVTFTLISWKIVTVFGSRYEKLQRWDDALKAYTLKASQTSNPHLVLEATLGLSSVVGRI